MDAMNTNKRKKRARRPTAEERERRVRLQHLYLMLLDAWDLYQWTLDTMDAQSALIDLHEEEEAYREEFRPRSNQETNALELVRYFTLTTYQYECFRDYVHTAYKNAEKAVASILKSEARCCDCRSTHTSETDEAVH